MKNSNVKHRLPRLLGGLCGVAFMFGLSACTDDLIVGTPEWLGTSIYEELESRGDYSVTLALINSAPVAADNYRELLSKTGSKTLFVADDAAWQRFFEKNKKLPSVNPWSTITSVESFNASGNELKVRRLLKSMMLNNAYVLDLLGKKFSASNANLDDADDACMRRNSSVSNMDMRGVVDHADFPAEKLDNASGVKDIDWWGDFRDKSAIVTMPAVLNRNGMNLPDGNEILYAVNGTPDLPTMVHFSPSFSVSNGFSSDDVRILSNGVANSTSQTVVNGVTIDPDNTNITCQNGYIHKMTEVPYPVSNMMEKLSYEPQYSTFYKQLQRFSYPYLNKVQKENLGSTEDVYTVRYINSGDYAGHCTLIQDYSGNKTATAFLPYDPAWNHYYLYSADGSYDYQMDAALMLVPRNDQMESFLNSEEGRLLTARYAPSGEASWDYFPDAIVAELMKNCMLPNFLSYLPTKVSMIKDKSQTTIKGLDTDKIADCYVCGNGVIYGLSMNIVPPAFRDVTSTMLIYKEEDKVNDLGFSVFYNFIQEDANIKGSSAGYASYLGSFDGTKYLLFCPYDRAMRKVIDPSSVNRTKISSASESGPILFHFNYTSDENGTYLPYAIPHGYELKDGEPVEGSEFARMAKSADFAPIKVNASHNSNSTWYSGIAYRMLRYIIENSICPVYNWPNGVVPLQPRYTFYKTKAGSAIRADWSAGGTIDVASYAGGYHDYNNRSVKSGDAASFKPEGNGATLPVSEVLLPSMKSPYQVLKEWKDSEEFFKFIEETTGGVTSTTKLTKSQKIGEITAKILDPGDQGIAKLRPYNYTIYVPTKAAIENQVKNYQVPRRSWLNAMGGADPSESKVVSIFGDKIKDNPDDLKSVIDLCHVIDTAINNYLDYHYQDYAVFLGQRDTSGVFETSLLNKTTNLFYGLYVDEHSEESELGRYLKVYPKGYASKWVEVDRNKCNIQATQNFYVEKKDDSGYGYVYSSAYVVIHQIANDEDLYMPSEINIWSKEKYDKMKDIFDRYGVTLPDPAN